MKHQDANATRSLTSNVLPVQCTAVHIRHHNAVYGLNQTGALNRHAVLPFNTSSKQSVRQRGMSPGLEMHSLSLAIALLEILVLTHQSCAPTDATIPAYLLLIGLTARQVGSTAWSILRGVYRDIKAARRALKWGKLIAREGFKELKRRARGKSHRPLLRENNRHTSTADAGGHCGSSSGDPFDTTKDYYGLDSAADEFDSASEQFDEKASECSSAQDDAVKETYDGLDDESDAFENH